MEPNRCLFLQPECIFSPFIYFMLLIYSLHPFLAVMCDTATIHCNAKAANVWWEALPWGGSEWHWDANWDTGHLLVPSNFFFTLLLIWIPLYPCLRPPSGRHNGTLPSSCHPVQGGTCCQVPAGLTALNAVPSGSRLCSKRHAGSQRRRATLTLRLMRDPHNGVNVAAICVGSCQGLKALDDVIEPAAWSPWAWAAQVFPDPTLTRASWSYVAMVRHGGALAGWGVGCHAGALACHKQASAAFLPSCLSLYPLFQATPVWIPFSDLLRSLSALGPTLHQCELSSPVSQVSPW